MARFDLTPGSDPGFDAPWQAQVFSMVEARKEAGSLKSADWMGRLGRMLSERQIQPEDYWPCYLLAFEEMLEDEQLATRAEIEEMTRAWHEAAEATPHGKVIYLSNRPPAFDG